VDQKHVTFTVALAILFLVASLAPAQDGLYAPVLPDDIALVRVINATEAPGADAGLSIDVGNTRIGPVAAGTGTAYFPVRPGVYVVFANGKREALTAASGTFQTILIAADRISIIADAHHEDPLRSQVLLYNASSHPVRLDAIVPAAALIPAVSPGQSGMIIINAIPVTLAAIAEGADVDQRSVDGAVGGDEPAGQFTVEITLERGKSYAVVVTGKELNGFVVPGAVADSQQ